MIQLCNGVSYDISDRQVATLKSHIEDAALVCEFKSTSEVCAALLLILNEAIGDEDDSV